MITLSEEPIMQAITAAIELAANQSLKWANNSEQLLAPLHGKACIIHLQELDQALTFTVSDSQVLVSVDEDGFYNTNPDDNAEHVLQDNECWVSVSVFALDKLKQNSQLTKLIKTGQLDFAGDLGILQSISKLFAEIDLDFEELLSKYIGDVAAYQVNKTGKQISAHVLKQLDLLKHTLADAALDEKPVGVRKIVMINFSDEVTQLRSDVERAEARLKRIESLLSEKRTSVNEV